MERQGPTTPGFQFPFDSHQCLGQQTTLDPLFGLFLPNGNRSILQLLLPTFDALHGSIWQLRGSIKQDCPG